MHMAKEKGKGSRGHLGSHLPRQFDRKPHRQLNLRIQSRPQQQNRGRGKWTKSSMLGQMSTKAYWQSSGWTILSTTTRPSNTIRTQETAHRRDDRTQQGPVEPKTNRWAETVKTLFL